jgi:hypothetical protein
LVLIHVRVLVHATDILSHFERHVLSVRLVTLDGRAYVGNTGVERGIILKRGL